MKSLKFCLAFAGIIALISCKKDCTAPYDNLYGTGLDNGAMLSGQFQNLRGSVFL